MQKLQVSLPRPTNSSIALQPSTVPRQLNVAFAAERTRLLFGCYRKGEANDPDTYTAAIAAILAEYPEQVIREVTDPRVGLPRKLSWLPTVKEVSDACDALEKFHESVEFMRSKGFIWKDDKWQKVA